MIQIEIYAYLQVPMDLWGQERELEVCQRSSVG